MYQVLHVDIVGNSLLLWVPSIWSVCTDCQVHGNTVPFIVGDLPSGQYVQTARCMVTQSLLLWVTFHLVSMYRLPGAW